MVYAPVWVKAGEATQLSVSRVAGDADSSGAQQGFGESFG